MQAPERRYVSPQRSFSGSPHTPGAGAGSPIPSYRPLPHHSASPHRHPMHDFPAHAGVTTPPHAARQGSGGLVATPSAASPSPRRDQAGAWSPRTTERAVGVTFRGPSVPSRAPVPGVRLVGVNLKVRLERATEPLGLHCKAEGGRVLVTGMVDGSAALRSGFMIGDIVCSLAGYEVHDQADMRRGRIVALDRGQLLLECTVSRIDASGFGISGSPYAGGDFSPEVLLQARKLGALQAAYNADALTREEFEAAVIRVKGHSPWDGSPAPASPPPLADAAAAQPSSPADEAPHDATATTASGGGAAASAAATPVPTPPNEALAAEAGAAAQPAMQPPAVVEGEPYDGPVITEVAEPQTDERFRRRPTSASPQPPPAAAPPAEGGEAGEASAAAAAAEGQPDEPDQPATAEADFDPDAFPRLSEDELRQFPRLSPEELHGLREEFDRADKNGDGFLRDKELLRAFLAAGMDPQTAHNMVMLSLIVGDANGDGQIDYKEFVAFHTGEEPVDLAIDLGPDPTGTGADDAPNDAQPAGGGGGGAGDAAGLPSVTLSSLPPEEVEHLRRVFKEFDTDGNGRLNKDELRGAMDIFAPSPEEADAMVEAILSSTDTDADGAVSYEEFMKSHFGEDVVIDIPGKHEGSTVLTPEMLEHLNHSFKEHDTNGDGCIEADELREILKTYDTGTGPLEGAALEAMVERVMRNGDTDGDGMLNYVEFMNANK